MTDDNNAAPRDGERIAKLLARAGVASRREVERMIAEGRVAVEGTVLDTPATVLPSLRGVTVDGKPVARAERTRLFRFHKPDGLITAERDPAGRPTIYTALRNALPADAPRVMPVGRLDFSTEGLLLLTNDGALKRMLELPATGVPRSYRARTFGDVSQAQLEELIHGITVEGIRYGKIDANLERRTGRNQWVEMTLTEGKNREVRRVLEHLGLQVSRLLRTAYGPFQLADLPRGAVEEVKKEELQRFLASLKNAGADELGRALEAEPDVAAAPSRPRGARTPTRAPARSPSGDRAKPGTARPQERRATPSKPTERSSQTRDTDAAKPRARSTRARDGETELRADKRPARRSPRAERGKTSSQDPLGPGPLGRPRRRPGKPPRSPKPRGS